MTVRLRDVLVKSFAELRYEPAQRRVRATLDGMTVVDSDRAMLVWEPRHVVPYFAVPAEDVHATVVPASTPATGDSAVVTLAPEGAAAGGVSIVPPGSFRTHSCAGEELSIRSSAGEPGWTRDRAAFRFMEPVLAGYLGLDFSAFDAWFEEEDRILAHPRDPFHRVDVRRSARHVRIELEGRLLAESRQARLLFETHLPLRFYLPAADVDHRLLEASARRTTCAYKGHAEYCSVRLADRVVEDLAWSYRQPLPEAAGIAGMIAFFDERVDVFLDGQLRPRPSTPWSRRAA